MRTSTHRRRSAKQVAVAISVGAIAAITGLAGLPGAGAVIGTVPSTERASVDSGTGGGRELPAASADGARVVFVGRGEGNQGVWLRDRTTDTTYRITTGNHFNPAISDDGNTVAYVVYGTNRQIYVRDITTPGTPGPAELVSRSTVGQAGNGISDFPSLNGDARYVAFQSTATNLTPETPLPNSGGPNKVYVYDRVAMQTEMVSVDDTGAAQPGNGIKPDLSADGRYVAFASEAVLDIPGGAPTFAPSVHEEEEEPATTYQQVYVRDRDTDTTEVVSINDADELGDGPACLLWGPTISDDGNRVAFESDATNLVPGDTNAATDAFVRDRGAGTTVRVSERAATAELGAFTPITPTRLLDTRDTVTPVGPGETVEVQVTGVGGVDPDAIAGAFTITATNPTAATHLTAYPTDEAKPATSNVNVPAGTTIANAATVKLSATGSITIYNNSGSVDVIVDLAGTYDGESVDTGGGFHGTQPNRALDTRDLATPVGPGETVEVQITGVGGVPATATAVALNVTATEPTAASHLTVHPSDEATPLASNVNFVAGQTIADSVVVKLSADGKVTVFNNAGSTHVVVDIDGWFDGSLPGGGLTSLSPSRLLDTRDTVDPLGPGETRTVQVTGEGGVPATGVTAVVLNVTATGPTEPSHFTVHPTGAEQPLASNLNFVAGQTIPNQVLVQVGAGGQVSVYNNSGAAHLIVDVFAWMSGAQVAEGGHAAVISADGSVVAFQSTSDGLTDDDSNGVMDVFAHTLATGALERASVVDETAGGTEASGTRIDGHTGEEVPQVNGTDPTITADGQQIAFVSNGDLASDRPEDAENPGELSTEPATYLRTRDV